MRTATHKPVQLPLLALTPAPPPARAGSARG